MASHVLLLIYILCSLSSYSFAIPVEQNEPTGDFSITNTTGTAAQSNGPRCPDAPFDDPDVFRFKQALANVIEVEGWWSPLHETACADAFAVGHLVQWGHCDGDIEEETQKPLRCHVDVKAARADLDFYIITGQLYVHVNGTFFWFHKGTWCQIGRLNAVQQPQSSGTPTAGTEDAGDPQNLSCHENPPSGWKPPVAQPSTLPQNAPVN